MVCDLGGCSSVVVSDLSVVLWEPLMGAFCLALGEFHGSYQWISGFFDILNKTNMCMYVCTIIKAPCIHRRPLTSPHFPCRLGATGSSVESSVDPSVKFHRRGGIVCVPKGSGVEEVAKKGGNRGLL